MDEVTAGSLSIQQRLYKAAQSCHSVFNRRHCTTASQPGNTRSSSACLLISVYIKTENSTSAAAVLLQTPFLDYLGIPEGQLCLSADKKIALLSSESSITTFKLNKFTATVIFPWYNTFELVYF